MKQIAIMFIFGFSVLAEARPFACIATDQNHIARQFAFDDAGRPVSGVFSGADTYDIRSIDAAGFGRPEDTRIQLTIVCLPALPGETARPAQSVALFEVTASELNLALNKLRNYRYPVLCAKLQCRAIE